LRLDQLGYVTTYTPELNIPIDDSWFEFDAAAPDRSPLQDSTPPAK
jgi:hypothetical protein